MQLEEIKSKDWDSSSFKVSQWLFDSGSHSISIEEQEFSLLKSRDKDYYEVNCSDQTFITKLSRVKRFKLKEVFINKSNFVTYIIGSMNKTNILVRNTPLACGLVGYD